MVLIFYWHCQLLHWIYSTPNGMKTCTENNQFTLWSVSETRKWARKLKQQKHWNALLQIEILNRVTSRSYFMIYLFIKWCCQCQRFLFCDRLYLLLGRLQNSEWFGKLNYFCRALSRETLTSASTSAWGVSAGGERVLKFATKSYLQCFHLAVQIEILFQLLPLLQLALCSLCHSMDKL